ncbi:hypothetical protein Dsin_003595 [Dipteronia sinensis]|uniref:RNase H type-1 domain-containing protein n=1 Tax=Dipteronia sinensis TaxID=43782 RepID=A0AAE0EKT3_9ROSI|nr:hypothetical protein Dsin_003595 [Dipteronia sinensis]
MEVETTIEGELLKEFRGSDAALDSDVGRYGAGVVVIRDDRGLIIVAAALSFNGNVPVEIAEAKAVLEGFLMAEDLGIVSLCIECDGVCVMRDCNRLAHSLARFAVSNGCYCVWSVVSPEWLSLLAKCHLNSCNSFSVE